MYERRMLIIPAQIVRKIDENRGDMSQADFIDFLIENHLKEDPKEQNYVTKEDLQGFEQGIKGLLRNFLEFFVSYGLELGKQPVEGTLDELAQKLQEPGEASSARGRGKNAGG